MVFLLQEWEAIESYHLICNPVSAQEISDGFCDQKYDLRENGVRKKERRRLDPSRTHHGW